MAQKTVFFYSLNLKNRRTGEEIAYSRIFPIMKQTISENCIGNSLLLAFDDEIAPVCLDVLLENQHMASYRLGKRKLNNAVQKRDYRNLDASSVFAPDATNLGVELFTYCMIDKQHAILALASKQGAPNAEALTNLFTIYNEAYELECVQIPNHNLIEELYNSDHGELNKILVEVPVPNAQVLSQILQVNDNDVVDCIQEGSQTLCFTVKPTLRGCISDNPERIRRIIDAFKDSVDSFSKVVIQGKKNHSGRQIAFDLKEQFFRYGISVEEYRTENGRPIEYQREEIEQKYHEELESLFTRYSELLQALCDRMDV